MPTEQQLQQLVIHEVKNREIFQYMLDNDLIRDNELYLVRGDDLFSVADKEKLDGIETGANRYIHPQYTPRPSGFYKILVDESGHVSEATEVQKSDITSLGIPDNDAFTSYVDNAIANNVAAPFVFSSTAPTSIKSFWIDTANSNLLKAYNSETSQWEPINAAFA